MSWGLSSAILVALEAQPETWLTVGHLARQLSLPDHQVRDELELLAAARHVLVQRAQHVGPIVGAMLADAPEAA